MAVHHWKVAPSEFWRMRPRHFWYLMEAAKKEQEQARPQRGKLSNAERARLKRLIE